MDAKTAWTIEQKVDANDGGYVAALNRKGVLAEFEETYNATDAGLTLDTEDAADFASRMRATFK